MTCHAKNRRWTNVSVGRKGTQFSLSFCATLRSKPRQNTTATKKKWIQKKCFTENASKNQNHVGSLGLRQCVCSTFWLSVLSIANFAADFALLSKNMYIFFLFAGSSMQTQSLFFSSHRLCHTHTKTHKAFTVFSHLIRLLRWFFGLTRKILWLLNLWFFSFSSIYRYFSREGSAPSVVLLLLLSFFCFFCLFVNRLFSHANCVKELKPN